MKGRKTRLKPQEIRTKQFNKKLFGYDPDEVEAFLIEVGNAYEELLKEIDFLQVRTPEYKVKKLLEKTRREAEKIIQGKLEEKKELERQMEKLEIEVEKLRLLQKQILEKLRMTIVDITKIMEALRQIVLRKKIDHTKIMKISQKERETIPQLAFVSLFRKNIG